MQRFGLVVLVASIALWSGVPAGATSEPPTSSVPERPAPATVPLDENEFMPDDRPIGDCISALPKPGCGSEARGGWAQLTLLAVLIVAIAFIVWRVYRTSRRVQRSSSTE